MPNFSKIKAVYTPNRKNVIHADRSFMTPGALTSFGHEFSKKKKKKKKNRKILQGRQKFDEQIRIIFVKRIIL